MTKKPRIVNGLILVGLVLVIIFLIQSSFRAPTSGKMYSEIIDLFENGEVSSFTLDIGNGNLQYTLEGETEPKDYKMEYTGLFVNNLDRYLRIYARAHDGETMSYTFKQSSDNSMWFIMLPMLLLLVVGGFAIYYFMVMQNDGGSKGAMNVGKAKVKNQAEGKNKATFKDVAGADEEKEELEEIVQFLKNPKKFNVLGARIPHGVLLVGPPGTGKTLLARACAGEAGVPFYSISGSDFVEMYVGVGASRVRDLFDKAKKTAPCIVFIDEIDAVGRQRGAGLGGGHDEREQTLNQLLVEMDGFDGNEGVIVVAATNRADILDKALLRPGRFDRSVYVGYPDVKGREEILQVHTRTKPLGPDVNLRVIARTTPGFTGADLENLVNEAALLAARRGRKAITETDIEEASIKVMAGPEKKSKVVTDKERRLTAYHEAGHAITAYYCKTADPVHQITIIPHGPAGGFTMYRPEEDSQFRTKTQMEENIVSMLGGRVAEKLVLDDVSTGASNDLERATRIARAMVTRYGFSERLGPVVYDDDPGETFLGRDFGHSRNYSEEVASQIDSEVRDMLDEGFEAARTILDEHMDQLHLVAATLIEREKISGDDFRILMEGGELPPLDEEEKKLLEDKRAKREEFNKVPQFQHAGAMPVPATEAVHKARAVKKRAQEEEKLPAQREVTKKVPASVPSGGAAATSGKAAASLHVEEREQSASTTQKSQLLPEEKQKKRETKDLENDESKDKNGKNGKKKKKDVKEKDGK